MSRQAFADTEYRIDMVGPNGVRPWAVLTTNRHEDATEYFQYAQQAGRELGYKYRLVALTTTWIEWTPIKSVTLIVRRAPVETVMFV